MLRLYGAPQGRLAAAVALFAPQWRAEAQWKSRGAETLLAVHADTPTGLKKAAQSLRSSFGADVYGAGDTSLAAAAVQALEAHDRLLACGDAAAGALLESRLEKVPGAEKVYDFGTMSYADAKVGPQIEKRVRAKLGGEGDKPDPVRLALARAQAARRIVGTELAVACAERESDHVLVLSTKKGCWLRTVSAADNPGLWLLDMVRRAAAGLPQAEGTGFLPAGQVKQSNPPGRSQSKDPTPKKKHPLRVLLAVLVILALAAFGVAWYLTDGDLAALPQRPLVSAFTATATAEVRDDIIRALGLEEPFVITTGFDRPNLYFAVEKPSSKPSALLAHLMQRRDKSGIVYCSTRKTVEEVCDMLLSRGLPATRYHAGLDPEERLANQDDFLYDRKTVMVATNAFGMGIDKSNVSFVIHYNMPKNMESYYQEAGRAGRDGEAADCILLYNGQDVRTAEFLIEHSHENEDESMDEKTRRQLIERDMERLKQMTFYATTTDCLRRYILNYFGEKAPLCCGHCGNCDTNFEEVDATMDARKILSCVYRLDERRLHFGKTVVAAVLTGSKSEQINRFHLDTLSTYGIMHEQTAVRVRQLIDVLLERGLLTADPERYNALFLTQTGNALMRGRGELCIKLPREKKPETAARRTEELAADVDEKLFEKLRALRTKVAQRAGVPPYVVFSNATLADMAARQPKSEYELLGVRGVGEAKARRYGAEFVDCIRAYLEAK